MRRSTIRQSIRTSCCSRATIRSANAQLLKYHQARRQQLSTQDFRLTVGARTEAVQVSAPTLEPTRAQSTTVLTALQIQNVPTPARRLQNLIWDTPGGQIEPECSGISVAGQKGIFTNVSVDGGDYNTTFCAGTGSFRGGSASAPTFNMDALQEFTVTRNIFAAEFGRTTGGVVNISTRSGTNAYRGTSTYLYRTAA